MQITNQARQEFLEGLWGYYAAHGRDALPWRQPASDGTFNPYAILVSELMLQQTQVSRVIPKYQEFLEVFPTVQTLAAAELGAVLRVWQGLGYNRRAKFLWMAAQSVAQRGEFPQTFDDLVLLPGVGKNTAGAILVYAVNAPVLFIETNIRTVYIHHFFQGQADVTDKEILGVLDQTLDREHPREFYWALMDYGSYLKQTIGNLNKVSKHYAKQSKFQGSRRQVRGAIIRRLTEGTASLAQLRSTIDDERIDAVLAELSSEGLIREADGQYRL